MCDGVLPAGMRVIRKAGGHSQRSILAACSQLLVDIDDAPTGDAITPLERVCELA